jgi:glycosyltransferase involved in cell wall biosynthesis
MNSETFFSIVIPSYNRAEFLKKTIHHLKQLDYTNYEVILVDDGSTDNTEEVIKNLNFEKLKYIRVENGERGRARNIGTQNSKGDFITFLDSDDIIYPNALTIANEKINNNKEMLFFNLSYELKSTDGKTIFQQFIVSNDFNLELVNGNFLGCIGVFLKHEVALENLFCEDRKFACSEDWQLWLVIASKYKLYHFNEICFCTINHNERSVNNLSKDKMLYNTKKIGELLRENNSFMEKFGYKNSIKVEAHMWTYSGLHLVLSKEKIDGIRFFLKGVQLNYKEIFKRRTLAIIKYLIFY